MGGNGMRESCNGIRCTLFCSGIGEKGHHGKCDQPWLDRGQGPQHIARCSQELIRKWHAKGWTAMGRIGTPPDIGNVVALFCSEQANRITGQVIYADGGSSLMNPEVAPEIQIA